MGVTFQPWKLAGAGSGGGGLFTARDSMERTHVLAEARPPGVRGKSRCTTRASFCQATRCRRGLEPTEMMALPWGDCGIYRRSGLRPIGQAKASKRGLGFGEITHVVAAGEEHGHEESAWTRLRNRFASARLLWGTREARAFGRITLWVRSEPRRAYRSRGRKRQPRASLRSQPRQGTRPQTRRWRFGCIPARRIRRRRRGV